MENHKLSETLARMSNTYMDNIEFSEDVLRKIDINVRNENGYKDFVEVLAEVTNKWNTLGDDEVLKQYILRCLVGTMYINKARYLIEMAQKDNF